MIQVRFGGRMTIVISLLVRLAAPSHIWVAATQGWGLQPAIEARGRRNRFRRISVDLGLTKW